jgi:hypothetical protein
MRFFRVGDFVIAEKVKSGRRYSLRPWQYEVMARFDGKRSFEDAAKEVYQVRPGAFTANGLLNFYNWLYTENLILCECESIFELVLGTPDPEEEETGTESPRPALSEFAGRLLRDSKVRRTLAVSAIVLLSLSVIRIVQVAAPVFEPPVNRLIAETSTLFDGPDPAVSVAVSERSASDTSVEKVSLAARVDPGSAPATSPAPSRVDEPAPPVHDPGEPAAEPVTVQSTAPAAPALPSVSPDLQRIEMLRVQLEECRIRRDEFYLQNDEEGYRREVHRMTNLAREIGDIEKAR